MHQIRKTLSQVDELPYGRNISPKQRTKINNELFVECLQRSVQALLAQNLLLVPQEEQANQLKCYEDTKFDE